MKFYCSTIDFGSAVFDFEKLWKVGDCSEMAASVNTNSYNFKFKLNKQVEFILKFRRQAMAVMNYFQKFVRIGYIFDDKSKFY